MRGTVAKRLRTRADYLTIGARRQDTKRVLKILKREHMGLSTPEKATEQVGVAYARKMGLDFARIKRAIMIRRALRMGTPVSLQTLREGYNPNVT